MTSPPPTTASATVWLSYNQIRLIDPTSGKDHPRDVPNGLVAGGVDAGVILTGVHTGIVGVTVQLAESEPPPSNQEWEETEEVTITSTTGSLLVCGMMASPSSDLPNLAHRGAGRYRLRVQARGRSHGQDTTKEPLEHFLVTVWPLDESSVAADETAGKPVAVAPISRPEGEIGYHAQGRDQWPVPPPGLLIGRVRVRKGRIVICNPYQQPTGFPEATDGGLVATTLDVIVIFSAVADGIAHMRVNFRSEAPRTPATTWQTSQDAEFITITGIMRLPDFTPIDDHMTPHLNLAFQGAGRYGIRVHGRSRSLSPAMAAKERGESYMLAVWPIDTAGTGGGT